MGDLNSVWSQLKATFPASLDDLVVDGYTRTLAGSGLAAINPFEVEDNHAPDPDTEDVAPYELDDWNLYVHINLNAGTGLMVTSGYGEVQISWNLPAGYSRAPGLLEQWMYLKDTGETTSHAGEIETNPFVTPDEFVSAGDGTSGVLDATAFIGNKVAVGVKVAFNDSDEILFLADDSAYVPAPGQEELTGLGRGIVVEVYDNVPEITNLRQDPPFDDPGCIVGGNVDLYASVVMKGLSTGRLEITDNGGTSWTLLNGAVPAGLVGDVGPYSVPEGDTYQMRLRYNSVSPDQWDTTTSLFVTCEGN